MGIYIVSLLIILSNGLILKNKRKWFILSSFGLLILVAALRSYEVGIDLTLHYASNYAKITSTSWKNAFSIYAGVGYYDWGFVLLCKLIGIISTDVQFFIAVTSIFTLASLGRFIYRYSADVALDTLLVLTSFTYFQYMCIIAQGIAVAIVLNGIPYLTQKKYLRYIVVVLVASLVHSSALICIVFILLQKMELKKENIFLYLSVALTALVFYQRLMPIIVNHFFPMFSFYIGHREHGMKTSLGPTGRYYLMTYALCILFGALSLWMKQRESLNALDSDKHNRKRIIRFTGSRVIIENHTVRKERLSSVFLVYMAISAFFFYAAGLQMEVSRRFMYYFAPFAYLLVGQSFMVMKNRKVSQIARWLFIAFGIFFYLLYGERVAMAGPGVVPYKFFWESI